MTETGEQITSIDSAQPQTSKSDSKAQMFDIVGYNSTGSFDIVGYNSTGSLKGTSYTFMGDLCHFFCILKKRLLYMQEIVPRGSKFFPYRVEPFQKGFGLQ